MTIGGFIEYLLDNDCDIARDIDCEVFQIKRRGKLGSKYNITVPYLNKTKKIKPISICRACHGLDVPIPNEAKHMEEVILHILETHKKTDKTKASSRKGI